jgi:hypothetical protein
VTNNVRLARRGGRPTKLTATVRRDLLDLIGRGASVTRACTILGVAAVTYYRWLALDAGFRSDAERARARGIQAALDSLRQAGQQKAGANDWRATEAWLHLVNPEEFGSKRMDERWVQEQQRQVAMMVVSKVVGVLDALTEDSKFKERFLRAMAAADLPDDQGGPMEASPIAVNADDVPSPTAACRC